MKELLAVWRGVVVGWGLVCILLSATSSADQPRLLPGALVKDGSAVVRAVEGCAAPAMADWNNDGKIDLLLGQGDGTVRLFLNQGIPGCPVFNGSSLIETNGVPITVAWGCCQGASPRIADWNNDGKKDLVVGQCEGEGRVHVFLNEGTDSAPVFNTSSFVQVGGSDFQALERSMPEVADWNSDGKKDLLSGTANGAVYLLINTSTGSVPVFPSSTLLEDHGGELTVFSRSSPAVADWDGDGKKDLLVGAEDGRVYFFRNVHTDAAPEFEGAETLIAGGSEIRVGWASRICVADWNGDGLEDLIVGSKEGDVRCYLRINPERPCLVFRESFVNDTAGNTNGMLDPGETVQIAVCFSNVSVRGANAVATLRTPSPHLSILNPSVFIGEIAGESPTRTLDRPFCVMVASNAPCGEWYNFELDVSCWGADAICATTRLSFTVGNYACTMVDFYWVDTSGGANLLLEDEGFVHVDIGFDVPFYGAVYTGIYVHANGFVSFVEPPFYLQPMNSIPNPEPPNCFIAPFWMDLDPMSGGRVSCDIFGEPPNRWFIVEWNGVPQYGVWGSAYAFEIGLHESGLIRFQYGFMSEGPASGYQATIGIEDADGARGIEYARNLPGSVFDGLAIDFGMPKGPVDTDMNGLPDSFETFCFGQIGRSPDADDDGDGASNWEEFIGGTDPTSPSSALCLFENECDSNGWLLRWQSVPGKRYDIEENPCVATGLWSVINTSPIVGDGSMITTFLVPKESRTPPLFYRILLSP